MIYKVVSNDPVPDWSFYFTHEPTVDDIVKALQDEACDEISFTDLYIEQAKRGDYSVYKIEAINNGEGK